MSGPQHFGLGRAGNVPRAESVGSGGLGEAARLLFCCGAGGALCLFSVPMARPRADWRYVVRRGRARRGVRGGQRAGAAARGAGMCVGVSGSVRLGRAGCASRAVRGAGSVAIYRSRVTSTSYKLQVTGYKLQVTSYRLQAISYKLQSTGYKLQATSYKLQVTSYKPHVTNHKLYVISYMLRATSYKLQVTSYKLQVTGYKL